MNILVSLVLVSSSLMQAPPVQSSTEPLVHENVVNAPVAAVWEAFTTKAGIESWMTSTGDIGRTRVVFKMFGYTSDEESQKMRGFFELGNKTTIDRLVKKFER